MAYTPTVWKNREVERPRTFQEQSNPDGTVTLIPKEGNVIESGTPIIADTMNKMELGIKEAHDGLGQIGDVSKELETHMADYIHHTGYGVATGSANAYIVTLSPALSAYQEGVSLRLKINVANTGASTVNANGLGAKTIKKQNGNAVTSGNLKAGLVYTLVYDGTSFILQGEGGEYGTAIAPDVLVGKTIGTENGLVDGSIRKRDGAHLALSTSVNSTSLRLLVPDGYYDGVDDMVYVNDTDFIASNIRNAVNLLGVIGTMKGVNPGDTFKFANYTNVFGNTLEYKKVSEARVSMDGTYRTSFTLNSWQGAYAQARIYVNGVAIGIERGTFSATDATFTEDIELRANDLVQIYAKIASTASSNIARVGHLNLGIAQFGTNVTVT